MHFPERFNIPDRITISGEIQKKICQVSCDPTSSSPRSGSRRSYASNSTPAGRGRAPRRGTVAPEMERGGGVRASGLRRARPPKTLFRTLAAKTQTAPVASTTPRTRPPNAATRPLQYSPSPLWPDPRRLENRPRPPLRTGPGRSRRALRAPCPAPEARIVNTPPLPIRRPDEPRSRKRLSRDWGTQEALGVEGGGGGRPKQDKAPGPQSASQDPQHYPPPPSPCSERAPKTLNIRVAGVRLHGTKAATTVSHRKPVDFRRQDSRPFSPISCSPAPAPAPALCVVQIRRHSTR